MPDQEIKKLVEAALFMSQNALSPDEISKALGIASIGAIKSSLEELIKEYKERDTSLEILEISGKYMFTLKEAYASKVSNLAINPDITKGALRLLAYVSKNNGIMQSNLVKIFGSSTYIYIKELTEKEFVDSKKTARSKKISVTPKFNEYFKV
jgi:segregation and condensation protein B